jgi:hypothetical protein
LAPAIGVISSSIFFALSYWENPVGENDRSKQPASNRYFVLGIGTHLDRESASNAIGWQVVV